MIAFFYAVTKWSGSICCLIINTFIYVIEIKVVIKSVKNFIHVCIVGMEKRIYLKEICN